MELSEAEDLCLSAVVEWLHKYTRRSKNEIDILLTFSGTPEFEMSRAVFYKFCDDVQTTLRVSTRKNIQFDPQWRMDHFNKSALIFIRDAVEICLAKDKSRKIKHRPELIELLRSS